MPDTDPLTSNVEPGSAATSTAKPETEPVSDDSTESQPSYEELQDRLKRLEANASGSRKEWEREKQARERAESENNQFRAWYQNFQAQQPQAQAAQPQTAPDDEIAEGLYSAVVDGDKKRIGQTLRQLREQAKRESQAEMGQYLQVASVQAAQSEAFKGYLAASGIAAGNPLYNKVIERAQELSRHPGYAFTGGHPGWITSLAVEQVRTESAGTRTAAQNDAREQATLEAFTEGTGSRGSAAPPGKRTGSDRIYLTEDEMKWVKYDERKGIKREDSMKRLWSALRPEVQKARREARHA